MSPQEFLDQIVPPAMASARASGIPASFTIAQAALESAWGASKLARDGMNLFGVKADKAWHGPTVTMKTAEYIKGKRVIVDALWRAYPNWQACLDDRAAFFRKNPRYSKCFAETTGEGWCRAVAAAGYATDPEYAQKLVGMIRARNLTRFDRHPEGVAP